MSEDLAARMKPRVQSEPTKRAAQAFRSPSDEMQRVTLYMPRATVRALKQAGLDQDTSVSKILTGLADEWLSTQQQRNNVKT
jgi:3-oxoacyl-(acyl-carrier-protein) synthase